MPIGYDELAWATRFNDAASGENESSTAVLAELDVEPDGALKAAQDRAARVYALLTGQNPAPDGQPVRIDDPHLHAALSAVWLDGLAAGLLARRDVDRPKEGPPSSAE